jgi:hypothetical protein
MLTVMELKSLASIALLTITGAGLALPAQSKAEGHGCAPPAAALEIRGDSFASIGVQIKSGAVRIGALELNYEGNGWKVTRPADAADQAGAYRPATQITIADAVLEIRSLDRKLGSVDDSPDAVLTAVPGERGVEIHIAAQGGATLVVSGQEKPTAPKEVAFSCEGMSLSPTPSVI